MASGSRSSVVRSIQTLFDAGAVAGLSDGQLLDRFLDHRGDAAEAAFAAIVRLHGPMVWGVCRGALADTHDAEDAFQATFLVLVRKASSVRRRDTLGPWLYGVARRVAVRARGAARRRPNERGGAEMEAIPTPDPSRNEDIDALNQELDRLPEKYRAVVILCHLEGRTQAEAARLLGCPIGTVGVRVSRAREILRDRLTRRGLALPSALAGAALIPSTTSASAVPAALAASTIKAAMGVAAGKSLAAGGVSAAAFHLSQGVIKSMTITKVAIVTAGILTAGVASTGIGWLAMAYGPVKVQEPAAQAKAESPRDDPAALTKSVNNLKQIGLALLNLTAITDDKDPRYPEPSISKGGKPLLSWRVAILPFLDGGKPLYDKFHLDEPWDSPHNKALLKEIPEVYVPVVAKAVPRSFTYYQAFVGPGALFEKTERKQPEPSLLEPNAFLGPILVGKRGTKMLDVTDGTSNTLMVAEAATPVPWTKPEDLPFDKDKPLPEVGGQFAQGFHAAMADGSALFLSKQIDPKILRALITRDGGEKVTGDQLRRPGQPIKPGQPKPTRKPDRADDARSDDGTHPAGWGGGGQGYSLTRDTDIKHGGKASGVIESTGQTLNGFGTFTQGIRADRYRGKRLRMSGFVKTRRATGKAGLWMRIDGQKKSPLAFDNMMNRPINGTTDWKEYDVVLDIPQDAEQIYFGFLMAGRGMAWVDDIKIETVGKEVQVTDLKIPTSDQEGGRAAGLPDEPVNLDFEK